MKSLRADPARSCDIPCRVQPQQGHKISETFLHPDEIRARFSAAMSQMYRAEVPAYGTLLDLVADVNG
jgi:hypothetical protein